MSKFSIIPKGGGTARYSGCPTFTGTYMKPGMLEFREVASPTPVGWMVGDYVAYSRTGLTYRLYGIPQVKKQARSTKYGGAFIYQSVQLFDDSKQLEICPFRDLVPDDNRIHFSTQPSISTFEAVDGIARRIQACLDDMYPDSWVVRLATTEMGASQDLVDLMAEAREFTVSGVSLLGALDKVYEVWPEVGWVFSHDSTTGKNVLTIGGAGLTSTASYQYSKGNGLNSITRTAANADEIANRIFAYGSLRNMLPGWYNSQNIKDAESVDIQNLMIPVSEWGLTDGERDAAKAYVEDDDSIAKNGLRPVTVYFDGSGEYPEIYPTLRETTIGMVRTAIGDSTAKYYPSTAIYADPDERIDTILSAQETFDSGLAGDVGKSAAVSESEVLGNLSGSGTVAGGSNTSVILATRTFTMTKTSQTDFFVSITGDGTITPSGGSGVVDLAISIQKGDGTNFTEIKRQLFELEQDENGVFHTYPVSTKASSVSIVSGDVIRVYLSVFIMNTSSTTLSYSYSISPGFNFSAEFSRKKSFNISVRQLGFDIEAQANLGEGKTIAMRSGKCAGRSFSIKSVQYDATTDSWALECWRSEDESLSQWFPNTDYPIEADDEFVLLDIAMPDIYVQMAEQRLLTAAQELLSDVSVERWQYIPEIDAKFMVESGRSILPAQNMVLTDIDIVGSSPESILIDTVTISEGEAAIPTYKVTLRDRKRKTFTEAKGADSISSKPVSNATQEEITSLQGGGDSFFKLDENGNVTLKPQYKNLWVSGWMAAGGVGSQSSGGGGLITSVRGVADLGTSIPTESLTDTFSAKAIETIWEAVLDLQQGTSNVSLVNGASYSTLTVNGVSADFYTKAQVDSLMANIDLSDYVTETDLETELAGYVTTVALTTALAGVNTLDTITTNQDGTVDFTWKDGNIVKVDLNHEHSNYVPKSLTINGVDLSQNRTFYVGTSPIQATAQAQNLTGILSIKAVASNTSMLVWDNDHGAWRVMGNLYADGWVAAGGIGSGSGGGGGTSSLYGLIEVESTTSPSANDVFYFNGTQWTNSPLKTVNNTSILGSGNITVSGGTEVEVYNLLSTGTRVATIRIGGSSGTAYDILAPTSGGGGASSLNDLSDVTISSVANGDLLVYNSSNSQWENVAKATALTDYALKAGSFTYNFQANSIIFNGGTLTGTTTLELAHRLVYSYTESGASVDDPVVTVSKTIAFLDDIPAHQTVTLTGGTNNGTLKLTTAAGTVDNIAVTGLQALAYKASLVASDIPDISGTYVTISGTQTITGAKTFSADIITGSDIVPSADLDSSLGYSNRRFANGNFQTVGASNIYLKNSTNGNSGLLNASSGWLILRVGADISTSYKQLIFHESNGFYPDTTGVNLGYTGSSNRWATIYGIDMDLTGNVTMASNKHIDLGPVRLEFANGALHVTTNDSTNYPNIGFYADGFVASGGVGTSGGGSVSGDYVSYGEAQSLSSSEKLQARTNIGVPTIVLLDDESELPASPDSNTIYLIKEATA